MKTPTLRIVRRWRSAVGLFTLFLGAAFLAAPALGEEKTAAPPHPAMSAAAAPAKPAMTAASMAPATAAGQPSHEQMMKQMMEMTKLNENHKMLADLAGTWDYTVKMWMTPDPKAPPTTSTGVAVRTAMMGGRYFSLDVTGKMEMPGPDGKMMPMEFKGMGMEGYDNVKKKFVSSWMDNMGTGIMMVEGTYDPAAKALTYTGEEEMMPGQKVKVREVVKVIDKDHHVFEWYDNMRGTEAKTMEIVYTRKK